MAGMAARPFLIFLHEVLASRPTILLHECSHLFKPERLAAVLGELYEIMPVRMNPKSFGCPYNRERMITWCVLKGAVATRRVFTGRQLRPFEWGTILTGEAYFVMNRGGGGGAGSGPSSAAPARLSTADMARLHMVEVGELRKV